MPRHRSKSTTRPPRKMIPNSHHRYRFISSTMPEAHRGGPRPSVVRSRPARRRLRFTAPGASLGLDSNRPRLDLAAMIARVTLEIALRKEFDYAIPPEFAGRTEVGSRVKVPFGSRQVLGVVTSLIEESTRTNLRSILKIIGQQSEITPRVLQLARWIAE